MAPLGVPWELLVWAQVLGRKMERERERERGKKKVLQLTYAVLWIIELQMIVWKWAQTWMRMKWALAGVLQGLKGEA